MLLSSPADFLFKINLKTKQKKNMNTTGVPTSLHQDQVQCLVGPDLGSNVLKVVSRRHTTASIETCRARAGTLL